MKNHIFNFKFTGRTLSFSLFYSGFVGSFQIEFVDKTRKNSPYKDLSFINAYFSREMPPGEWSKNFHVKDCTNAMLFVERSGGWILDTCRRAVDAGKTEIEIQH